MTERYCVATGRDGVPDLDWYFSYNLFRLTGIVQGIKKRIVDGTASSAQAEKSAAQVYRLAKGSGGKPSGGSRCRCCSRRVGATSLACATRRSCGSAMLRVCASRSWRSEESTSEL